ncbi:DNA polymerase III subunit gamma/tau [Gudongella sp. DL1XJH-153]|uniref:DNA polymerase III subunit gamma/tau n=1 Tax=Gudongella sp. DL1XJH-153 TaxID=3409804 RepID=UPI003BB76E07
MYQALYRQYRPRTFDEILGQTHITKILKNQIKKDNIGHAYLFSGTRGTGKTSAAKVFSRAVNCLNPQDGNPCNECAICKGILDESLMDVIEMDAASNRKIEDIRELKEKVIYPPSKARFKVYIIDEVHMLTNEAFNALLKTLEEPPKHLLFLLATTEPERLPQTILSRCQRFDFKRLSSDDMIYGMKNITDKLGIEVEDKVLQLIAKNSDGAMRDALSLLDQCIAFEGDSVSYDDAINILGIANVDLVFELVDSIKSESTEKALRMVDHMIQEGKDISQFLKDMIHHYRNLMISKTSKNPETLIEWGEVGQYKDQSDEMELHYLMSSLEVLTSSETSMKWSMQPRIILEMAVIRLVNLKNELSLEERVKRLEEGISAAPIKKEVAATAKPNPKPLEKKPEPKIEKPLEQKSSEDNKKPVPEKDQSSEPKGYLTLEGVRNSWAKVMQIIKSRKINIYALVMEGEVSQLQGNRITLSYKDGFEFHKDAVNSNQNKEFLEEILTEFFGQKIELLVIMKGCEMPISGSGKQEGEKSAKDETVNKVLDFFGEDIVEIK